MMKKLFALVLVLALAMGTLAVTASAATVSNAYEVGYAKVDINPYWHEWKTWSENKESVPAAMRGKIPTFTGFTYDEYDMLPLPMGGYGTESIRLSRAKLMDDNGSGEGAGTENVTISSGLFATKYYYRTSTNTYGEVTDSNYYTRTALYTRSGWPSSNYKYTKVTNYQDVHLDSNRYTKDVAQKMGVRYEDDQYGDNDGDGIWASCVMVHDPQSNSPVLMVSVDNLGIDATLIGLIKDAILKQSEVKSIGLTRDRIFINSNHTHGSVALATQYSRTNDTTTYPLAAGTFKYEDEANVTFTEQQLYWYLNFYKNHLMSQIAKAAVAAIGDMEVAQTMEKGTIDVSDQTDYQMNGVRHNVQTYNGSAFDHKESITYVRGSSFNNHMDGNTSYDPYTAGDGFSEARPVTDSDDSMHILQFTFENKEPIVMVNFRAHSTANNKELAKLLHYNISSDWVSPLRYEMERKGYRFSLLYGNSGNLGTGVSADENKIIPHDYANYNTTTGKWELPATPYGRQLAQAALALLGEVEEENNSIVADMTAVNWGKIQSVRSEYILKKQQWSKLAYAAALQFYEDGFKSEGGAKYEFKAGDTVTYTDGDKSVTLDEGGTFVIASDYHAKSIKSHYEEETNVSIELNAIRMGDEVAFVTTPVEASDRYFTVSAGMDTSDVPAGITDNDWNKLIGETWGTPFMISITNGYSGYVPNQLAYDYNKDYNNTEGNYMVAVGSYESHISLANRGEGENMVATLNTMLRSDMESKKAVCPHCENEQVWLPLSSTSAYTAVETEDSEGKTVTTYEVQAKNSGHYFLASDYDFLHQVKICEGATLCLDLNGNTYSAESYSADSRAYTVQGMLNICDSSESKTGKLQGCGVKWSTDTAFTAGTLNVESGGTVNLYSGNLTMNHVEGYGPVNGGVLTVSGTFNMYDGNVYGGIADNGVNYNNGRVGGNIYVDGGTFNMEGGKVYGGNAGYAGGNIYVNSGEANLTGGSVEDGDAQQGGNIYANGGTLTLTGTTVTDGTATGNGGNLYVAADATCTLTAGTISGGNANSGGNVFIPADATFELNGGSITSGSATYGGNVYTEGSFTLTSGTISDGSATYGGNIQVQNATSQFTMTGGTVTGDAADKYSICTSANTLSNTRLAGGEVEGNIYVQGNLTLTGTTNGMMNISVKVPEDRLTIEGTYTGQVNLTLNGGTYSAGSKIASLVKDANITEAQINVTNLPADTYLAVEGDSLILRAVAQYVAEVNGQGYEDISAAVEESSKTAPVILLKDVEMGTLEKNVYVDLNGCNILTVTTGEFKLYCLDSETNDYDVTDEKYGTVPAGTSYQAASGYLPVTDKETGKISFHKYEMSLQYLMLSPSKLRINYTSYFRGDQIVASQVKEFGIAMRAYNAPNETSIWSDPDYKTHTTHGEGEWKTGNSADDFKGVGITNIISSDPSVSTEVNKLRAEVMIYGRPYILLETGEMLFGDAYGFSMRTATMEMEEAFAGLSEKDQGNLVEMYKNNREIMKDWGLTQIMDAAGETSEENSNEDSNANDIPVM